jgi:hypothetical protein
MEGRVTKHFRAFGFLRTYSRNVPESPDREQALECLLARWWRGALLNFPLYFF